jgi:hypothetical protein
MNCTQDAIPREPATVQRSQVLTASGSGEMSVGGSIGLAPNNSRARASSMRTSFSCCCSAESVTPPRYCDPVMRTIHSALFTNTEQRSSPERGLVRGATCDDYR